MTSVPYAHDFAFWAEDQSRILRARDVEGLDWDNLAEEIESLGRRERNEIRNRLRVLLVHLLKWEFQPERRSHWWQTTIGEQRIHIGGVVEDSPSLKRFPADIAAETYEAARRDAARQTKLPAGTFPDALPYSVDEILDDGFMPGRPWSPEELS